jgi:hypothetical protein
VRAEKQQQTRDQKNHGDTPGIYCLARIIFPKVRAIQ